MRQQLLVKHFQINRLGQLISKSFKKQADKLSEPPISTFNNLGISTVFHKLRGLPMKVQCRRGKDKRHGPWSCRPSILKLTSPLTDLGLMSDYHPKKNITNASQAGSLRCRSCQIKLIIKKSSGLEMQLC